MENEVLQTVLTEVLQELKEVKQQQAETEKALSEMKDKVGGFEQKLTDLKLPAPTMDARPITTAINTGLERIKSTIEAQPKSIVKQYRILLFPEYNAAEYYRIVFGRVLFWMFIFLAATYLFVLGNNLLKAILQ